MRNILRVGHEELTRGTAHMNMCLQTNLAFFKDGRVLTKQ